MMLFTKHTFKRLCVLGGDPPGVQGSHSAIFYEYLLHDYLGHALV